MGTAVKHPVPDRVKPSFVIFDIRALWRSALSASECPDVKITNDGLTRSGTGCFTAVPIWQLWASKGELRCIQTSSFAKKKLKTVWFLRCVFDECPTRDRETAEDVQQPITGRGWRSAGRHIPLAASHFSRHRRRSVASYIITSIWWSKKVWHKLLSISLPSIDRFSIFFTCTFCRKFVIKRLLNIPCTTVLTP